MKNLRKELVGFLETLEFHGYLDHDPTKIESLVEDYWNPTNSSVLDETKAVRQNEHQKELCYDKLPKDYDEKLHSQICSCFDGECEQSD